MDKVRGQFKDIPTYCTFDIDAIDPANCPGTGKHQDNFTLGYESLLIPPSAILGVIEASPLCNIEFSLGTPEVAGLTPIQAYEIIRGLKGINIIGGDLVEVSFCPTYIQL